MIKSGLAATCLQRQSISHIRARTSSIVMRPLPWLANPWLPHSLLPLAWFCSWEPPQYRRTSGRERVHQDATLKMSSLVSSVWYTSSTPKRSWSCLRDHVQCPEANCKDDLVLRRTERGDLHWSRRCFGTTAPDGLKSSRADTTLSLDFALINITIL